MAVEDDRPPDTELESREPTLEDLRDLCRALNERHARYVVIGGFAIRAAGYNPCAPRDPVARCQHSGHRRRVASRHPGLVAAGPGEAAALTLAGRKVTADGVLLIDSREHRTQAEDREAARERLLELLRRAAIVPKSRRPTKVTRGAKQRRLAPKRQRAEVKAARRRPSGAD